MPKNTLPTGSSDRGGTSGGDSLSEQAKTQTQQAAGQVTDQAKEQAASLVATQKGGATESLSAVAQALRQTGQTLQEDDQAAVGQLADKAAAQVERVSGYLQERDMSQLVGEIEGYTRRSPALVLGGAFVLGRGINDLKQTNLAPEQTLDSLKEDTQWAKDQTR